MAIDDDPTTSSPRRSGGGTTNVAAAIAMWDRMKDRRDLFVFVILVVVRRSLGDDVFIAADDDARYRFSSRLRGRPPTLPSSPTSTTMRWWDPFPSAYMSTRSDIREQCGRRRRRPLGEEAGDEGDDDVDHINAVLVVVVPPAGNDLDDIESPFTRRWRHGEWMTLILLLLHSLMSRKGRCEVVGGGFPASNLNLASSHRRFPNLAHVCLALTIHRFIT